MSNFCLLSIFYGYIINLGLHVSYFFILLIIKPQVSQKQLNLTHQQISSNCNSFEQNIFGIKPQKEVN